MPGPTPLVATHRLKVPVTVDGLLHNQHFYCDAEMVLGILYFKNVDGGTHVVADDAIDNLNTLMARFYQASTTVFGQNEVEEYIGGAYVPVWFHDNLASPGRSEHYGVATQTTIIFRDDTFKKIRLPLMETVYTNPLHYINVDGGDSDLDNFIGDVLDRSDNTHIGYWLESRSAQGVRGFVSTTATDNRRLRRDRGTI